MRRFQRNGHDHRVVHVESVTSGHPDKLCDAISDTIVDACLAVDPHARVAVETLVKGAPDKSIIVLAGEVSLSGEAPDYEALARWPPKPSATPTMPLAWMRRTPI